MLSKSVLLVAALAAMSSILAIAHNYGAALIDDSNRHLVGKGLHGEGQIIGADEEIEVRMNLQMEFGKQQLVLNHTKT